MNHLYELSKELAVINDALVTAEGEITPELETRLDAVNLALVEKATGLRKWIAIIDGDNGAIDAEIKRLQTIARMRNNLRGRLMEYIRRNMEVADLKKLETPIGTFSIARNPASVEPLADGTDELTPEQFRVPVPATWRPEKRLIKEALEAGYDVPGWRLIVDRTSLRVK